MNFMKTAFAILILLVVVSCNKKGCRDNDALNYDKQAEESDFYSCYYQTNCIVHWDNNFYEDSMQTKGSTTIYVYMDGELKESLPADSWGNFGDCGEIGSLSFFDTI